jgi:hypothetical protein
MYSTYRSLAAGDNTKDKRRDRQNTYNVTLRGMYATIVAEEKH